MTGTTDPIRDFFRRHRAAPIGSYLQQPETDAVGDEPGEVNDFDIETPSDQWAPITPAEAPAKADEGPRRFIDGSHIGHAVLSIRSPEIGCAVPLMLSEVGGIAMNWERRGFVRDFFGLERVVSMVADLFPWDQIEVLARALRHLPGYPLRLLPANRPDSGSLFDYEQMRKQAQNRSNQEMADWEAIALSSDRDRPVVVDGRLEPRLRMAEAANRSLVVGVIKQHAVPYLHPQGFRALLDLRPGQRTPVFRIGRRKTNDGKIMDLSLPVVSWYVKLGGVSQVGPNYGFVRVEVAWVHFQRWASDQKGFTDRLSRWLIDARCRQTSYSRMAVTLEPIVRAEDSLKSLFTPFTVLRNRFYLAAGVREEDV
jgi:hypothetical protein